MQLARYFEAEVTGACSAANADMVKSLGADKVIDYAKDDFTKNGETYDIIFDTVGKTTFSRCKGSLVSNGLHLATTGNIITNYLLTFWTSMVGSKKFIFKMSVEQPAALLFLTELIEAGKLRPVIDRRYRWNRLWKPTATWKRGAKGQRRHHRGTRRGILRLTGTCSAMHFVWPPRAGLFIATRTQSQHAPEGSRQGSATCVGFAGTRPERRRQRLPGLFLAASEHSCLDLAAHLLQFDQRVPVGVHGDRVDANRIGPIDHQRVGADGQLN